MIQKNSNKQVIIDKKIKINSSCNEIFLVNKNLYHYGSFNLIGNNLGKWKQNKDKKQGWCGKFGHIFKYNSENQLKINKEKVLKIHCGRSCTIGQCQILLNKKIKNDEVFREDKNELAELGSISQRNTLEIDDQKIQINLKETSSTTCPEMVIKRQMPTFLKIKSRVHKPTQIAVKKFTKQQFIVHKKLGQGKFGKVYLVQQIVSGYLLAMKVVNKNNIISSGLFQQFVRQLKIQTYLRHSNIIQVYGFFYDSECFYTLMELGCDGQLYNLISQKKKLTQQGTSFITKNLLQAINYIHKQKITHRDIKPQNIVRIMGTVKICDFGWAVNKINSQELRSTYCGTPFYLSPEILKGQKYDEKVDLWAIGILAYELLLGKSPFQIYDYQDLYKIVTEEVHFPSNKKVSKEFQQFIELILKKNPKQRLGSSELLQLKFIKKYQAFETCEQLCQ